MDTLPQDEIVEPVADTVPPVNVGKLLSEARIEQGLSVSDVAGRIKFSPRQVEALEAGDFARLPELAFVRGFVRSYARLLHLDEVVLLNALPQTSPQAALSKNSSEVPFPTAQSARRINVVWLAAALGLAVILIIGISLFHEKPASKKIAVTKPAEAVSVETLDTVASAVEAASASAVAAVSVPDVAPTQVMARTPTPALAAVVAPVPVVHAVSSVPLTAVVSKEKALDKTVDKATGKTTEKVPVKTVDKAAVKAVDKNADKSVEKTATKTAAKGANKGPIRLVFRTESWVDIKDKFGKTLFKQVNEPGSEQWVDGRGPFSVVIGNASGVRLYYEGEEIDLKEFTDIEVARLTLE
jgi:cytoskeleton protein RodZ